MSRAAALDAYLHSVAERHFDWRHWNCCHFVAGWAVQRTGIDPMQGLPSTASQRSAHRLIRTLGGTLAEAWSRRLGAEALPATLAQPGDVVLVQDGDLRAVGLCLGHRAAVLSPQGLAYTGMAAAVHAWRLP